MDGYNRLRELIKDCQRKHVIMVVDFLLEQTDMNEKYLNEEKNIQQMEEFINKKAKELAVNNVAVIEDETVYKWAIEYFDKSNEELGFNKKPVKTTEKPKVTGKEEKPSNQMTLEFEWDT